MAMKKNKEGLKRGAKFVVEAGWVAALKGEPRVITLMRTRLTTKGGAREVADRYNARGHGEWGVKRVVVSVRQKDLKTEVGKWEAV